MRRAFIIGIFAAAGLWAGSAARASITQPADGATVSGNVAITESAGGCANTRIEVHDAADRLVAAFEKGSGGAYTATWASVGFPRGRYILRSYGAGIVLFGGCVPTGFYEISSVTVTLRNGTTIAYSGPTSAYHGDPVAVQATLTSFGTPVRNRTVRFAFEGGYGPVEAVTDRNGVARTTLIAEPPAGASRILLSFAGDDAFEASSAAAGFTVIARPTSIAYTGPGTVTWADGAVLSARLSDPLAEAPLDGKRVTFRVTSGRTTVALLEGITDSTGRVAVGWAVDVTPGSYAVTASYGGDAYTAPSAVTAPLSVAKRPTSLAYTGPGSAQDGEDVRLTARLTDAVRGDGVAGRTLTFSITFPDGPVITLSASTDGAGEAAVQLALPAGSYAIGISFGGDAFYVGSSASQPLLVSKRRSLLTYTGPGFAFRGQRVRLGATLADRASTEPLAGRTITWTIRDAGPPEASATTVRQVSATTDASGEASVEWVADLVPGSYTVTASFAGDGDYGPASASRAFQVAWEYVFVDDSGNGVVYLNPSTKELEVVTAAGSSGIVSDPNMRSVATLVVVAFRSDALDLAGIFDRKTKAFAAAGRLAGTPYALASLGSANPPSCVENPLTGEPVCR